MREDGTADEDVVVFEDEPVQGDGHFVRETARREFGNLARGDRAQVREGGRVVPAMVEDPGSARVPVRDRASHEPAQRRVVHRHVRAEGDEVVQRGHAAGQLPLEHVEHERHGHGPRPVRNEDEHAPAVQGKPGEPLGGDARDLFRRELALHETASERCHAFTYAAQGYHPLPCPTD